MSKPDLYAHIPEEMRQASLGSFPLSPGIMTGHYKVAHLYWNFRKQLLQGRTIKEVFGSNTPAPPKLQIPSGHIPLTSIEGLNKSVWEYFLQTSFSTRPNVNVVTEIRELISTNAEKDKAHFEKRIAGQKSQVIPGRTAPSLLRAFTFENSFPVELDNEFFRSLIPMITNQIVEASKRNFSESWSASLKGLVLMWNAKFPDDPFIPDQTGPSESPLEQTPDIKPTSNINTQEYLQQERLRRHLLYRRRPNQ